MLDLAALKMHLRVDDGCEDAYISSLMAAAIGYAQQYTGKTFYKDGVALADANDPAGIVLGDTLTQGLYLLIGHWYNAREAVNIGNIVSNIPMSAGAIFDMYRKPTL